MVVFWAFGGVAVKLALRGGFDPIVLPGWRALLTTLILLPVCIWDARRHPHSPWQWSDSRKLAVISIAGISLNQLSYVLALSRTSVAHQTLIVATLPMMTLALAVMARQERATVWKIAGMMVALSGVGVLQLNTSPGLTSPLGDFYSVINAASFAVFTVLAKDLTARYGGVFLITAAHGIGAACLLPLALLGHQDYGRITSRGWMGFAYLVVFQGMVGYLIFYFVLRFVPASRINMFSYVQPVLATVFAYFILGETINYTLVLGGILILAGIWVARRPSKILPRQVLPQ